MIKPLWGEEWDDLYYIATLIDQYEHPLNHDISDSANELKESESDLEDFSAFTRGLILLKSGLSNFPTPLQEQALTDFIENFKELYPHLFLKRCPRWVHWITEQIENLNV